ncbi:MAG: response regulator [Bacteroidales bacterium]|nr:response regulator [Bacteroidales bacterium]
MVQDWSDKKILVAEDEFIGKKYLEKILSFQNAKVYFANNGEEAVEAVRNEDFDMILMDLKMPVKNGFDATREIKQMRPKIPVIAQTALAFPADKARAEESGCDDFIIKPIIRNELIAKISRLFEQPLLEFN